MLRAPLTAKVAMTTSHRRLFFLTAAAALGSTLPNTAAGFVPPSPTLLSSQTRLYSFNNNNNNNNNNGFLDGLGQLAKKVLPKSWTQSEEERRAEIQRKERADALTGGLTQMFRDAPFPARVMGGLVAPLVSSMVSGVADMVQSQQQQLESLLDDAAGYILADPEAAAELGEPIRVEPPFSQSTSSSSINGKTTTNVQASFYVLGSRQQGVATMVASENGIQQLMLQVNGRNWNIPLSNPGAAPPRSRGKMGNNNNNNNGYDDNIIDVEFTKKEK